MSTCSASLPVMGSAKQQQLPFNPGRVRVLSCSLLSPQPSQPPPPCICGWQGGFKGTGGSLAAGSQLSFPQCLGTSCTRQKPNRSVLARGCKGSAPPLPSQPCCPANPNSTTTTTAAVPAGLRLPEMHCWWQPHCGSGHVDMPCGRTSLPLSPFTEPPPPTGQAEVQVPSSLPTDLPPAGHAAQGGGE